MAKRLRPTVERSMFPTLGWKYIFGYNLLTDFITLLSLVPFKDLVVELCDTDIANEVIDTSRKS